MQLSRYMAKLWADPYVLVASLLINLLSLAVPLLMLQIYDRIIPRQGVETLAILAIGTATAVLAEMVIRGARTELMALAGDAFERRVQTGLFERLLKADINTIEAETPGTYIDRITSVDRVREYRHGETAMVILDVPFSILFMFITIIISPVLALVVTAILLVSIMANRLTRAQLPRLSEKKKNLDNRRFSFLLEVLDGIEVIKSLNLESFMERRYERLMSSTAALSANATTRSNFAQYVAAVLGQLTPFAVASAGSILVINQSITVGALAAVILLATRTVQPMLRLEALRTADQDTMRAEAEISKVLNMPLRPDGSQTCEQIDRLDLVGITLQPGERPEPLFKELNLTIQRGEFIALEGQVGSGRSTLLWLMMGFVVADSGEIRVNGEPASHFASASLRNRIAYLSPAPKLLEGTVLENMTRFQPNHYLDEAIEISAALGLSKYFAHHQEGLTTKVGNGLNSGLPTSVVERIPLVGALVGKPDIVLFDEANANLDMEGDTRLKEYLASLKGQAAVVMITQRPSYLAMADRTLRIENGALVPMEKTAPANPQKTAEVAS